MRKLLAIVAVSAALAPSGARAGLVLGARLGGALPLGGVARGVSVSEFVDVAMPMRLDLGYRFRGPEEIGQLMIGAYFGFAPGKLDATVADHCPTGATCSVYDLTLGLQFEYRLVPGPAGTWLGGFGGFEGLALEQKQGGQTSRTSFDAWQLGAQGGFDWAWKNLTFGPYGALGVGQYFNSRMEASGSAFASANIDRRATHAWLQLGIRGSFTF